MTNKIYVQAGLIFAANFSRYVTSESSSRASSGFKKMHRAEWGPATNDLGEGWPGFQS